jgi:tellurite resistance protein
VIIDLNVGQPRVRFPADAFFCLLVVLTVQSLPCLLVAVQDGESIEQERARMVVMSSHQPKSRQQEE